MTTKQLLIDTLRNEAPIFVKVIAAVPADRGGYKPHERARTAENLAQQLAMQPLGIGQVATTGLLEGGHSGGGATLAQSADLCRRNCEQALKDLAAAPDGEWETGTATLRWEGKDVWKAKRYEMAWGLLLDAIHHRGQLSTYLRAMGAKVPSIYGGSADEQPA
jgi:hypothetical protein